MTFKKRKSSWNKGKKLSDEHRKKLSDSHKGQVAWNKGKTGVFSEENKKKHSEFMKEYYKSYKHPMLGKKQSKESIRKAVQSRNKTLLAHPEIKNKLGFKKGNIPWNKGKLLSKVGRQKLHRITIENMQKIAKSRGGKCLSDNFVNVDTRLKWQCEKGHIWESVPSSIKRGSWCSRCSRSK
jgi:hypothetical protein